MIDSAYGAEPTRITEAQERFIAASRRTRWPGLHEQAQAGDAYWSTRIADWPRAARGEHEYVLKAHGLVNTLSRLGNDALHPSFDVLFSFHMTRTEGRTTGAIHPERRSDATGNSGLSLYIGGWASEVAGHALGAPDIDQTQDRSPPVAVAIAAGERLRT